MVSQGKNRFARTVLSLRYFLIRLASSLFCTSKNRDLTVLKLVFFKNCKRQEHYFS